MKNKGPLFAMIGIIIFAVVVMVKPWTFFQKEEAAVEQTADEAQDTEESSKEEAEPTAIPTEAGNPSSVSEGETVEEDESSETVGEENPMDQPHDPANLYDIEGSDFMN